MSFPGLGHEGPLYHFTTRSIKSQLLSRPLQTCASPPWSASQLPCLLLHPQTGMRQIPACGSGPLLPLPVLDWQDYHLPLSPDTVFRLLPFFFVFFMDMCMAVCLCVWTCSHVRVHRCIHRQMCSLIAFSSLFFIFLFFAEAEPH